MTRRKPFEPKDGPYTQRNRDLLNVLYKFVLHPSMWDTRPLLTFSPLDSTPGVVVSVDRKFPHAVKQIRHLYEAVGYLVVSAPKKPYRLIILEH